MSPQEMEYLILLHLSKYQVGLYVSIEPCLAQWDGTNEQLIKVIKNMNGKSIFCSTYQNIGRPIYPKIEAKLTKDWHTYFLASEEFLRLNKSLILEEEPTNTPNKKVLSINKIIPLKKLKSKAGMVWKLIIAIGVFAGYIVSIVQLIRWVNGID